MSQEGMEGPWIAAKVQCHCCTNEWYAVFPVQADETELECPSCGFQDSEVIDPL